MSILQEKRRSFKPSPQISPEYRMTRYFLSSLRDPYLVSGDPVPVYRELLSKFSSNKPFTTAEEFIQILRPTKPNDDIWFRGHNKPKHIYLDTPASSWMADSLRDKMVQEIESMSEKELIYLYRSIKEAIQDGLTFIQRTDF